MGKEDRHSKMRNIDGEMNFVKYPNSFSIFQLKFEKAKIYLGKRRLTDYPKKTSHQAALVRYFSL